MDLHSTTGSIFVHVGRNLVNIFFGILFLLLLCVPAFADGTDLIRDELEIDALEQATPDAARDVYGAVSFGTVSDLQSMPEKLWTSATGQSRDLLFSALCGGAQLLSTALLASLCLSLVQSEAISLAGTLAVSFLSFGGVSSCADVGREALQTLADYSHVLLPCLCTAATVSGGVTSASAKYAASMLVIDGAISACEDYLFPFLSVYAVTVMAGQITENELLQSISGLLKQAVKWSLVLITTGFTIYLSLTGLLTGTVDQTAAKAAKTAISGALPVVGGILSDASAALLSGAQMLCSAIGTVGLLVVLAVCLTPYLTLGCHYLVYQLAGSAAKSFSDKRIGNVIKGVGDVYAFLLGIVGSVSIMLFVSVVSLMKAVTM